MEAHVMPQPFGGIKDEERYVEPLKLLLAVYQLVVQHTAVYLSAVTCEDETEESYGKDVATWHELCLNDLCRNNHK